MSRVGIPDDNNGNNDSVTPRRTGHACVQCRSRKQRCGGYTANTACMTCQNRNVRCSYEDEAVDPRYNPYLRYRSRLPQRARSQSPPLHQYQQQEDLEGHLQEGNSFGDGAAIEVNRLHQELDSVRSKLHALESERRNSTPTSLSPTQSISLNSVQPHQQSMDINPSLSSSRGPTNYTAPARSLSSATFHGPLRTLQSLGEDDNIMTEDFDPVTRQVLTRGEVAVLFDIYFRRCHMNAPFLDAVHDSNSEQTRATSLILCLSILTVGARFWGYTSKSDNWLHPRYRQLVELLDGELHRIVFQPRPNDVNLGTVQALMVYSHWMPVELESDGRCTYRFSELSAYQGLGLALRWAMQLGLDKATHLPFLNDPAVASPQDVRQYRTMLYLVESDHYMALSARRPPSLDTTPLFLTLSRFIASPGFQTTDVRLVSLLRVAHAAFVIGRGVEAGNMTTQTLQAFNEDVAAVERDYVMSMGRASSNFDQMSQHFPFTSLRWYRLAFACTLLTSTPSWPAYGDMFHQAIDCASQILFHLSASATSGSTLDNSPIVLEPEPALVEILSFAIDHYFVAITYTASFLVVAWQRGAINDSLEVAQPNRDYVNEGIQNVGNRTSLLHRLINLAARTLDAGSPQRGHLASRYAGLIYPMAELVAPPEPSQDGLAELDLSALNENPEWNIANLWQQAGLDPFLLYGNLEDMQIGLDPSLGTGVQGS